MRPFFISFDYQRAMRPVKVTSKPEVKEVFKNYPKEVLDKLNALRSLIIETASEMENISELREELKWGEPSYLTKHGSTLRIDWKKKHPNQYAMYFQCTSKLVPSFKLAYNELFRYEGTRALLFDIEMEIPEKELKQCIKAALHYHKVKDQPLLGIGK